MAALRFTINKKIKYGGKIIQPNTEFEVKEEHVDEIKALGGHLIEGDTEASDGTTGAQTEEDQHDEEDEDDDDHETSDALSHEAIVARAEELGIEVGKKGDKALLKLIRKAELEE